MSVSGRRDEVDKVKERYGVEPEYAIEPGCRCCSCWEPTGKWLVVDSKDEIEDLVFETREEAEERSRRENERESRESAH